jgi:hypothetical protein
MKQRITVNQLDRLSNEHKVILHKWWTPQKGESYVWHYTDGQESNYVEYMVNDVFENIFEDPETNLIALPVLNIGQMIAFIQEKKPQLKGISKNRFGKWFINIDTAMLGHKDELCDALWDATVQILKNP